MSHLMYIGALLQAEIPKGTLLQFDKELLIKTAMTWVNVIVLAVVMTLLLYKPVKKFMSARTERIRQEIENAQSEKQEVIALQEKYEALIAGAEKEREELLRKAYHKAMEKSDTMLEEARQESENIRAQALADIETQRKKTEEEMKNYLIELSVLMASRFVEVSLDREKQDEMLERVMADWGENVW